MTTIIGLRSGGTTYMAADSRVLNGSGTIIPTTARKLFSTKEWVIGVAGWKALLNICDEKAESFALAKSIYELSQMLRSAVVEAGWTDDRNNGAGPPGYGDVEVLVGSSSGLWSMDCAFTFSPIDEGHVWGIGSGWRIAAGAAVAIFEAGAHPYEALQRGIEITVRYDGGSDSRVQVVRLEGKQA